MDTFSWLYCTNSGTFHLGDVLATWSIAVPTQIGFHGPAWGRS